MKGKTKLKIIRKSIELFNQYGFSNISLGKIADELKLSPGNLTYHYKKKDDLMNAVYSYFQSEINKVTPQEEIFADLHMIDIQAGAFYNFQKQFQFFYLDLLEIERAFPTIATAHYIHIEKQISRLLSVLIYNVGHGSLIKYRTQKVYNHLARQLWMTSVYWMSQSMIRGQKHKMQDLKDALWYQIYPHLTNKGLSELAVFNKIGKFI